MATDKSELLELLRRRVQEDLDRATGTHREVQAGATHAEARPENDKDTRALEATYLARGLAERVAKLEAAQLALARLQLRDFADEDPIALAALVTLEAVESGERRSYFIVPAAGGLKLTLGSSEIATVTPEAPIGRSLIGSHVGDDLKVPAPQGLREMEIVALE